MFSRDEFGYLGFAEGLSTLSTPPCVSMTQTWYEPTLQVGAAASIPVITPVMLWEAPYVVVFKQTLWGASFMEAEFGTSAFSEGGRTGDANVLIPGELVLAQTWYEPTIQAGVLLTIPGEIAAAKVWNVPAAYAGVGISPDITTLAGVWYAPNLEFEIDMPASSLTAAWYAPDVYPGVLVTITGEIAEAMSWYAPAMQVGSAVFLSSIELIQTWYEPTVLPGVLIALPSEVAAAQTWYAPTLQVGVDIDVPLTSLVQTWYELAIQAGVLVTLPSEVAAAQTWYAPQAYAGVYIEVWNVTTVAVPRGTFASATFSSAAFDEGGLEDVTSDYSIRLNLFAFEPQIQAGVQIQVPLTTLTQTWYPPEISARPRRVRTQYISY